MAVLVRPMKALLAVLTLALASLAIPSSSAAPPVECTFGPTSPGGDTHCEGGAGECEVLVHMYDVEDALNQYHAECYDCGVHIGGGGLVECPLVEAEQPTPLAASSAGADLDPEPVCQDGIAQTWCDVSAGPCDVRVVPWTAWGDVYAWADCDGPNMMRCYAEAHLQDPLNPEQWCAF